MQGALSHLASTLEIPAVPGSASDLIGRWQCARRHQNFSVTFFQNSYEEQVKTSARRQIRKVERTLVWENKKTAIKHQAPMKNTIQKLSVLAVLAITTASITEIALTAPTPKARETSPAARKQLEIDEIIPRDAYLTFNWGISVKIIRPKLLASDSRTIHLADGAYCWVD